MLPFQVRVDLGAMAMKGYSAFAKAPALLKPRHHIQHIRLGSLTPLHRSIGVFYRPTHPTSRLNHKTALN